MDCTFLGEFVCDCMLFASTQSMFPETLAQKRLESGTSMLELTMELHGGIGDVQMQVMCLFQSSVVIV